MKYYISIELEKDDRTYRSIFRCESETLTGLLINLKVHRKPLAYAEGGYYVFVETMADGSSRTVYIAEERQKERIYRIYPSLNCRSFLRDWLREIDS